MSATKHFHHDAIEETMRNMSISDTILMRFVLKFKQHPYLGVPHEQDGYVYASDGQHIVRIPGHLVTTHYPNTAKVRFSEVWPELSRHIAPPIPIDAEKLQEAILSIPTVMEIIEDTCEDCDGEGTIFCPACKHHHDCSKCDGEGVCYTNGSHEIADPDYLITFSGTSAINPRFLVNLLHCAEFSQGNILLLTHPDTTKIMLFKTGIIEVGIMPVTYYNAAKTIDIALT